MKRRAFLSALASHAWLLAIGAAVGFLALVTRYEWRECRAVGHGWFYCASKVSGAR